MNIEKELSEYARDGHFGVCPKCEQALTNCSNDCACYRCNEQRDLKAGFEGQNLTKRMDVLTEEGINYG